MEKIVGICGSRDYDNYDYFKKIINNWIEKYGKIDKIVSGEAPGIDLLAEKYAKESNIPIIIHNAEWSKYNKKAGPIRNTKIVNDATHLIDCPSINSEFCGLDSLPTFDVFSDNNLMEYTLNDPYKLFEKITDIQLEELSEKFN